MNFFGRWKWRVLPLHALLFGFWFVMMDSDFIPSDDAIQEVNHLHRFTALKDWSRFAGRCAYTLLSDVWAPTLRKICGTQESHALKKRPYLTDA